MIRIVALSLLFAASTLMAASHSPRQHLPGFNGVAFGTPFDDAQKKLGKNFKADTDPGNSSIRILLGNAKAFGENFSINYSFERAGKLTNVYAVAKTDAGDVSSCKADWAKVLSGLKKNYGQPDTEENHTDLSTPTAFVTFKFADGGRVEASLLGCLLMVNLMAPN